jgi:hypothetical protein
VWGSELAMTSAEARSAASLKSASTSWLMLMYGTQSQLAFTVAVHPVTPLLRGTCTCGGSWLAGWLGRSLRCFMLWLCVCTHILLYCLWTLLAVNMYSHLYSIFILYSPTWTGAVLKNRSSGQEEEQESDSSNQQQ